MLLYSIRSKSVAYDGAFVVRGGEGFVVSISCSFRTVKPLSTEWDTFSRVNGP